MIHLGRPKLRELGQLYPHPSRRRVSSWHVSLFGATSRPRPFINCVNSQHLIFIRARWHTVQDDHFCDILLQKRRETGTPILKIILQLDGALQTLSTIL